MRFGIFGKGRISATLAPRLALAVLTIGGSQVVFADDDYEDWTARFQTTYGKSA